MLASLELASILQAAVAAPSAENRHFFEIQAVADGLSLFGNDAYRNAAFHHRLLCLVSFGAVTENVVVRAARLGYQTNVHWLPDPDQPSLIAHLRLSPSEPSDTSLDAAIAQRHTNRRVMYSGPRLKEASLNQLRERIDGIDGVALAFFDSGLQRPQLLRLMRIAETARFETPALHHDLFSGIRFDVGWHASADEGLPPAALGVEPGMRWAFAQLRRWSLVNALRHAGVHYLLGFRAGYLPCRMAPHLGVVTTSLPLERGALAAGRAFERIWLETERSGLALQPFAGPALLARPEYDDVPTGIGQQLRDGWKGLTNEIPIIVFRLGHARRPEVRTGRRAPERYLRE